MLHEARARELSAYWFWKQEVIRNQRAAEVCGGTDYSYAGRVREERAERSYKEETAYRKRYTELCKKLTAKIIGDVGGQS